MDKTLFTISLENNSFLWLPAKTCSTTLSWILTHFDFNTYYFDNEIQEFKINKPQLFHLGHNLELPPNHQKMSLICSMRHPYERVVSMYKMSLPSDSEASREDFEKRFERILYDKDSQIWKSSKIFEKRKPDHIIKNENLLEDLLKIPFVENSKLYQCGILEEMVNKKLGISFTFDIEEVLTKETKNKIYEVFEEHFEIFNYLK